MREDVEFYLLENVGNYLEIALCAAGGRASKATYCAAVGKIEEKRKPEDFFGHRKRGIPSFRLRNDTLIGSVHLPWEQNSIGEAKFITHNE